MRITTGIVKGMKLKSIDGLDTRPTSDRVKQSLFNTIQFDIDGMDVLDLFAGTGQLGLEALSRGANRAVFVDNSPAALSVIRENVRRTGFGNRSEVVLSDYKAYLKSAKGAGFHLVFVDPPYREGFLNRILNFIQTFDIVKENGIIICEGSASEILPDRLGDLELVKRAKYGNTSLTYYKNSRKESPEV
jgi:16S rRNA (guanine966-N2)-methyltransferase